MTWLGSCYVLLPLCAALSLLLVWAGRPSQSILLSLSLVITMISVHSMKLIFRRARPVGTDLLVPMPTDWSFPSAHTAQATALFLALTLIAVRVLPPLWAGFIAVFSLFAIAVVGYSRVYLQVHYISDVLAGMALAMLTVSAAQGIVSFLPWLQGK